MKNKKSKKGSKNQVSIPNFKIEQSQKSDITANGGMSVIYEKLGKEKKAKEFYEAAITMSPSEVESRFIAGQAYATRKLYERAKFEWRKALDKDPLNSDIRERLAWLLLQKQK